MTKRGVRHSAALEISGTGIDSPGIGVEHSLVNGGCMGILADGCGLITVGVNGVSVDLSLLWPTVVSTNFDWIECSSKG